MEEVIEVHDNTFYRITFQNERIAVILNRFREIIIVMKNIASI